MKIVPESKQSHDNYDEIDSKLSWITNWIARAIIISRKRYGSIPFEFSTPDIALFSEIIETSEQQAPVQRIK